MNQYILVVGGAGYIGSHVNKELSKKGYQSIVYDNLSTGNLELVQWGDFILGDLGNIEHLKLVFRKYKIAAVMHFAACAYVQESMVHPRKYYVNNVVNTMNLLNIMQDFSVNKFIFSSSCATYGNPIEIPITERHPQNPINPYGQSKLMVEKILNDYSKIYDFKYVSLRYFNAAGADPEMEIGEMHDPETHLIPLSLDSAIGKRPNIKIFGTDFDTPDGTCIRDYIHVTDLSVAHIQALEYLMSGGASQVLNLGNDKGYTVREVIEVAKKVTKKEIPVIEEKKRLGDPAVLVGSAKKAKQILSWEPKFFKLQTIIETAWKWHIKMNRGGSQA
jgi:UDP-glucose 4-epimerase